MKTFSAEVMWFLEGGRQQKELINLRIAGGDHGFDLHPFIGMERLNIARIAMMGPEMVSLIRGVGGKCSFSLIKRRSGCGKNVGSVGLG